MNWKQFKDWMEAQGVKDDDELWYIDVPNDEFSEISDAHKHDEGWAIT